jgi:hypothetical protein
MTPQEYADAPKYEITDIAHPSNPNLHRIRATRPMMTISKGDLGGYIQHEHNLSQQGVCWIFDDVQVTGNFRIEGDVWVHKQVVLTGEGTMSGERETITYDPS